MRRGEANDHRPTAMIRAAPLAEVRPTGSRPSAWLTGHKTSLTSSNRPCFNPSNWPRSWCPPKLAIPVHRVPASQNQPSEAQLSWIRRGASSDPGLTAGWRTDVPRPPWQCRQWGHPVYLTSSPLGHSMVSSLRVGVQSSTTRHQPSQQRPD